MSTRKIIDTKQNGEKVWPKGHTKANYMSDDSTVEDTIKKYRKLVVGTSTYQTMKQSQKLNPSFNKP